MEDFKIKEELNEDGTIECYTLKVNMGGYYEKRRFDNKQKLTVYLTELMADKSFNINLGDQIGDL